MMRFVTSCITGRSPQTSAGATLLRAFSVVLADGPTWASRSQSQSGVQPSQKPNSAIFVLVTNLSSHVIEEDSPHRPTVLGAIRHRSGDAVLHVGLCRQNADASVNVLREPLRFHGLVVLFSFRHESSVLPEGSLPAAADPRPSHEPHTSLRSHPYSAAEAVPHFKPPTLQHPRANERQR